ncbi:MAG: DUF4864 domain-containing protein [Rhizobiaceae bacterium]
MPKFPVNFVRLVLLAIMLVLTLPVIGLKAQTEGVDTDTLASRSVVEDQLNAFKERDLDRAYSHAAPGIRSMFPSVEQFSSMVERGYTAIYSHKSYVFGRNRQESGNIVHEVIITDEAGRQWQAVYSLKRQEDGNWRINGVKLNPYKGGSA